MTKPIPSPPNRRCEFCGKPLAGLGLRRDARHCSVHCRAKHNTERQRAKRIEQLRKL